MKTSWPIYGIVSNVSNSPVRIESRNMYIDMPIYRILEYLLSNIPKNIPKDKTCKILIERRENIENALKNSFSINWLSIMIVKYRDLSRPIGVRIRVNWEQFFEFLNDFSKDDNIPLKMKYDYLDFCRDPLREILGKTVSFVNLQNMQMEVKSLAYPEIRESTLLLDKFQSTLRRYKRRVDRVIYKGQGYYVGLLSDYLSELIDALPILQNTIESGLIPSVYRELRKILESLGWAIFFDVLFHRDSKYIKKVKKDIPPLRPSREWYTYCNRNKLILNSIRDFKNSKLSEDLYFYSQIQGYKWSKKRIQKAILKNLDVALYILLTSSGYSPEEKEINKYTKIYVPMILTKELETTREFAKRTLSKIIMELKQSNHLNSQDKRFIEATLSKYIDYLEEHDWIVPAYPSNSFVVQYLGFLSGTNLNVLYDSYSLFVHAYPIFWTPLRFSSVLEFKILRHELEKFVNAITSMLKSYEVYPLRYNLE